MSDLDRELEAILFKAAGGVSDMAKDEIRAIKQAVDKHLIGEDEKIDYQLDADWCLIETSVRMGGIKPIDLKNMRNSNRGSMRASLWGQPQ